MIDLFGFVSESKNYYQFFYTTGGAWTTWEKPNGVSMIFILLLSGGGGGGGGTSGATATDRRGAGGGGGSPISRLLIPAALLPDRLYLQIGAGGLGGAIGTNGTSGEISTISILPSAVNTFALMTCAAPGPGFSVGALNGSGNSAVSVATRYTNLGIFNGILGISGGNGSLAGVGSPMSSDTPFLGGGGGGGANIANAEFAGGGLTTIGNLPNFSGGAAGNPGQNGTDGLFLTKPLFASGGAGGGGSAAGTAGNGGNGSYGSGGGGGGGGITAGIGGRGGDGIAIIVGW